LLEIHRHESEIGWRCDVQLVKARPLPSLGRGVIDFKHPQNASNFRPPIGEGIEAGSQDHVLGNAAPDRPSQFVFDITAPYRD